ncbi:MAG TPA: putative cobaltochelatase [Chloroflexi bacterium]|nr:putative cobaltochelatase [Chloroflexota bacterium]
MKLALILNAISPQIGGVLIRGERGTAKSTAARALAYLLPEIKVVADCPFNCDPDHPEEMCDNCRERLARGEKLPVTWRKTRFVDLPVSATEDRVVGTLDIETAIKKGKRRFEPGVLAAANRGLLYVDEVNLLDDHVVDLLLDSAAMGVNVVEREGISFTHPARFILVGTMNPEEGELRPQLLDRFALCVEIKGITDPHQRVEIVKRTVEFEKDPQGFRKKWEPYERQLSQAIAKARELLPSVSYTENDLYTIAKLTSAFRVDGHRADIVILKTAIAYAAFKGRRAITEEDIMTAAELALPHRLKKHPFQEGEINPEELETTLRELSQESVEVQVGEDEGKEERDPHKGENPETQESHEGGQSGAVYVAGGVMKGYKTEPLGLKAQSPEMPVPIGHVFKPRLLCTPLDRLTRRVAGKRSYTKTTRKRGRYIRSLPAHGNLNDVALDATIRYAAPYQTRRPHSGTAITLRVSDIQRKVRVRRASNLILFVVDASWSMAASERMKAAKGAVMSLLHDAYRRRDRVGLIVFQKDGARLVLPPTSSVELAQQALKDIPVGGKTPLSSGLYLAHKVIATERLRHPELRPLLVLLTDGAANVSMGTMHPQKEALKVAEALRKDGVRSVVINLEYASFDRGLAKELADALGGPCYRLRDLAAGELYRTVKDELGE